MKFDKKTIIIIAIVAVVAFLVYKMWKQNKQLADGSANGTSTTTGNETATLTFDATAYNKLINTYCGALTDEQKKQMLSMCASIFNSAKKNDNYTYAGVSAKAEENGVSYDKQIFFEALWQVCVEKVQGAMLKSDGQAKFNEIVSKVRGY